MKDLVPKFFLRLSVMWMSQSGRSGSQQKKAKKWKPTASSLPLVDFLHDETNFRKPLPILPCSMVFEKYYVGISQSVSGEKA